YVTLAETNLTGADLTGAKLKGANLRNSKLSDAILLGADFTRADLTGVDFQGALCSGTCFSRANLKQAKLNGVSCGATNFCGADLQGADLSSASLNSADLSCTILCGTNFANAALHGADLSNVHWNQQTNWRDVRGLQALPSSINNFHQKALSLIEQLIEKGKTLVKQRKFKQAIAVFQTVQALEPKVKITANAWWYLCKIGVTHNQAGEVIYACNKAVEFEADPKLKLRKQYSRAIARSLNDDFGGAIADLQFCLEHLEATDYRPRQRLQNWIDSLKQGKNPCEPEDI
ncbi:MAG: pentapeptide repeat-containing protein, partial [Okeania sp. SIO2D1]|nr:pentapeptide repeat-containing protein [Okeania sp. SIO2D1]